MDLGFRLLAAPPRLSELAAARLEAFGLLAIEPGRPEPDVVALIDPRAVVDVAALEAAAAAAAALQQTAEYPATSCDGSPTGPAVTLISRDARTRVQLDVPLGAWLPEADRCVIPSGPARAVVFGIFEEPTGYAAVGRNLVLGLAAHAIPVGARIPWWREAGRAGLPPAELAVLAAAAQLPVDRALPAVLLRPAGDAGGSPSLSEFAATRLTGLTCAYTMFECDDVPGHWVRTLREFDQVWVPSTFNLGTFAQAGIPAELLRVIPIGIDTPTFSPDGPRLTLPNRRRVAFLSVFDWNERKGPDVLLRAWARAFGPDDDVVLYLRTGKSTVGARGGPTEQIRALGLDPLALAPIEVLSESLPVDTYAALFRSVDAFVLTSRGEAFCIPLLEAMASGLPAIGTGWGGSADFLDETTGFPIPARLAPVARELADRVPFYAGQRWADPSVEATAAALRRIVDDPGEVLRRAAHGFARAHLAFDRRVTARAAERALAEPTPRRTVRTAGRTLLTAPLFADDAGGHAARGLFDALAATGATPRVAPRGAHDADLDPIQGRHLRRAARLESDGEEAKVAVDVIGAGTRAVFLTAVPEDLTPLSAVERIWTDDATVARVLHERGVAPTRLTVLRLPVDVTLWTPDAHGPATAERTIYVAPEPGRVEALTAFARLVDPADDVVLVIAPLPDRPVTPEALSAELEAAMRLAGVARWNPRIVAIPFPPSSRHAVPPLATVTIALAADPSWPEHERTRACGVPVLCLEELDRARLLLADRPARDAEGVRTRRAAVARARADAAAVRTAFDEIALLAPLERGVRPLRIAAVLGPAVNDPARVLAGLRAHALHEIVGVEGDLRGLDYVVRVERAVETAFGWDEVMVNALESRGVMVVESFDWEAIAPNFPEYTFEEVCENSVFARNCEAGARVPLASGALQMVRAIDATATGPVWRSVAAAVRALAPTGSA